MFQATVTHTAPEQTMPYSVEARVVSLRGCGVFSPVEAVAVQMRSAETPLGPKLLPGSKALPFQNAHQVDKVLVADLPICMAVSES